MKKSTVLQKNWAVSSSDRNFLAQFPSEVADALNKINFVVVLQATGTVIKKK